MRRSVIGACQYQLRSRFCQSITVAYGKRAAEPREFARLSVIALLIVDPGYTAERLTFSGRIACLLIDGIGVLKELERPLLVSPLLAEIACGKDCAARYLRLAHALAQLESHEERALRLFVESPNSK